MRNARRKSFRSCGPNGLWPSRRRRVRPLDVRRRVCASERTVTGHKLKVTGLLDSCHLIPDPWTPISGVVPRELRSRPQRGMRAFLLAGIRDQKPACLLIGGFS